MYEDLGNAVPDTAADVGSPRGSQARPGPKSHSSWPWPRRFPSRPRMCGCRWDVSPLAIDTDRTGAADGLAAVVEAGVDAQTDAYYRAAKGRPKLRSRPPSKTA